MEKRNSDARVLMERLGNLMDRQRNFEVEHKETILQLLQEEDSNLKDIRNLSISELHVIDCIGSTENPNVTFIAESTGLTKSAVSKISTRLLKRNMIQTHRKENNKKEILYSLTEDGAVAYRIHRKFHDTYEKKLWKILESYQPEEIETVKRFIDALLAAY